jgi:hypothetical protein
MKGGTGTATPKLEAQMTGSHEKSGDQSPFASDLERNPGIGQSKGSFATGEDPETLEGENTVEGDVDNDVNAQGGIDEDRRERTNE